MFYSTYKTFLNSFRTNYLDRGQKFICMEENAQKPKTSKKEAKFGPAKLVLKYAFERMKPWCSRKFWIL